MGFPRNKALIILAVFIIVLSIAFLHPPLRSSCPSTPSKLSSNWQYLGMKDAMRIYSSSSDPKILADEIIRSYGRVYYYARSGNVSDLNLSLPDLPPTFDVIYMLTVPSNCGAETYAIVSNGGGSKIYVGVVPVSDSIVPLDYNDMFCESLVGELGCAISVSELISREGNVLRHYCYIQTTKDINDVRSVFSLLGNFIGMIGNAEVYHLDNNINVNLVPGDPVGIIAYRTVEANAPQ